jgi:hypothetical protein
MSHSLPDTLHLVPSPSHAVPFLSAGSHTHTSVCPHLPLYNHVSPASFLSFVDFLTVEDGNTLSRNISKRLPFYGALYPRRLQISSASQRKPQFTDRLFGCLIIFVITA